MKYRYEGYDRTGQLVNGEIEANDEVEVRARLRELWVSPRRIMTMRANLTIAERLTAGRKPNLKDFSVFIRQWATMQGAGLTLIQSLSVLSEQAPSPNFSRVLSGIVKSVQEGSTLTQALQKYPGAFDKIFINLVSAGEGSGTLDKILERLSLYYEKTAAMRRKIIAASLYPTMILLVVFCIIIGLLVFVVPMFERMFADQGKELPYATTVLLHLSNFVRDNLIFILMGAGALITFVVYMFKNEEAREKIDPFLLMIPIFGSILQKSCIARFTRTLGTLMQAGVPILDAFLLAGKTAGNYRIEEAVTRAQVAIKEGSSIAQPLSKESTIPKMVVSMISVGEQTGELEKMLVKIAEFYEDEVDTTVGAMTSILEPLLIVVMGLIVVSVLIPLYLPIFKLGDLVGGP